MLLYLRLLKETSLTQETFKSGVERVQNRHGTLVEGIVTQLEAKLDIANHIKPDTFITVLGS